MFADPAARYSIVVNGDNTYGEIIWTPRHRVSIKFRDSNSYHLIIVILAIDIMLTSRLGMKCLRESKERCISHLLHSTEIFESTSFLKISVVGLLNEYYQG
mmetsp:Transcript_27709/g.55920  ORF Transcript_27709/g.55920 Transcript_27709/m.55920 type:complete len:101 (+) Transcript_27709:945-1247(+)